jgi:hypothetical protein
MNCVIINELKELYRNGFLMTPRGKKHLKIAVSLKKEWEATKAISNIQFNTSSVDTSPLGEEFKSRLTKITITPIGINNCCHQNADFFSNKTPFERRSGWNMTACPCGKFYTFELHSINKLDGVQYDFTKDFNDETEKYFLEIRKKEVMPDDIVRMMGDKPLYMNKGCSCHINWAKKNKERGHTKTDEDDILRRIRFLENIHFHY